MSFRLLGGARGILFGFFHLKVDRMLFLGFLAQDLKREEGSKDEAEYSRLRDGWWALRTKGFNPEVREKSLRSPVQGIPGQNGSPNLRRPHFGTHRPLLVADGIRCDWAQAAHGYVNWNILPLAI